MVRSGSIPEFLATSSLYSPVLTDTLQSAPQHVPGVGRYATGALNGIS